MTDDVHLRGGSLLPFQRLLSLIVYNELVVDRVKWSKIIAISTPAMENETINEAEEEKR